MVLFFYRTVEMRASLISILFMSASILFDGCESDPIIYSEIPEISLQGVSPITVSAYNDSITFVISYTDGDGDLGENSPTAKNLFLTDSRIGSPYQYRISELAPNSSITIRGTLTLVLYNPGILGTNPESVTFSIYVKDRAGHTSNTITSPVITVNP